MNKDKSIELSIIIVSFEIDFINIVVIILILKLQDKGSRCTWYVCTRYLGLELASALTHSTL